MSDDSDPPPSEPEPTRALLLAQALETCIQAERKVPGSADQIIARRPAWMRAELRRLLALANALDATATNAVMSDEIRAAARARLMRRIAATAPRTGAVDPSYADPSADASLASRGADDPTGPLPTLVSVPGNGPSIVDTARGPLAPSANGAHAGAHPATAATTRTVRGRKPRSRWLWRGAIGGILAALLAALATLSASASSLPGQPLYGIKQATEEIGVRFAPDDQARTLMLLRQANARLDETAQLLDQGRTDAVADSAQRYDDALDRATTTYVVTIAEAPAEEDASTTAELEATLSQQHAQLQTLLASAPQLARAELSEALVATERSRALVAAPKPSELVAEAEPATSAAAAVTGANTVTATNAHSASTPAVDRTDNSLEDRDNRAAPPSAATPVVASGSTTSAGTQVSSSSKPAAAPPPVDLVAPRSDVTPYVPLTASHMPGADSDAHAEEVDALHAAPADPETTHRDGDAPTVSSGGTPSDGSHGRRDSQRVEHLQIPALAPPPGVAQARSTSGPSASGQSGPPAAADDADDDHVMTPSPNQNDTRGRVAVQVTPPPAARLAADADPDDHQAGGGPGPAVSAPSGGGASQNASAEAPGGVRAARELAADQRSNLAPASPTSSPTSAATPSATSARAGADTSAQGGAGAATRDRATGNAAGSAPASGGNPGAASGGNGSAGNSNTPARPRGVWSSAGTSGSSGNSGAASTRGAPNPSSGNSPGGNSPSSSSPSSSSPSGGSSGASNGSSGASNGSPPNGGRANGAGGQPAGANGGGSSASGSSANGSGGSQPGGSAGSSTGPSGARH